MKKNYFLFGCAMLMGTTLFGQTNIISNGTFADNTLWIAQPATAPVGNANNCATQGITFSATETHTADGSGSWNINCTNALNRLRTGAPNNFTTVGAGTYTVKVWVKKTGADNGLLQVYLGPNNSEVFSAEGDFTVTDVNWVEVTRTFPNLPAATTYLLSFENSGATGTNGFRIDDVLAYENAPLGVQDITKDDANIAIVSTDNKIVVNTSAAISKLEVYSVSGQLILSQTGSSNELSTAALAKNVYVLKVFNENGGVSTKKFVK